MLETGDGKEKGVLRLRLLFNILPWSSLVGFAIFMLFNPFPHNSWQQQGTEIVLLIFGFTTAGVSYLTRDKKGEGSVKREDIQEIEGKISGKITEKVTREFKGEFSGEFKGESTKKKDNGENRSLTIFATIYAIVNGLGITKALELYVGEISKNLETFTDRTFTELIKLAP